MNTRAEIETDLAKVEADLAKAATNLAKACATPAATDVCLPKAFSVLVKEKVDLAKADADLVKARAFCRRARIELARLNRVAGMPIGYRSEPTHIAHEAAPETVHTNRRKASEDRRRAHVARTGAHATRRMAGADRRLARPALANRDRAELLVKSDGWTDKMMKGAVNDPNPGTTVSPSYGDAGRHSTQSSEHLVRAVEESARRRPVPQKDSRRPAGRFQAQEVSSKDTGARRSLAWEAVQLSSLTLAYLLYYYIDVQLQIAMLPPSVSSVLVG